MDFTALWVYSQKHKNFPVLMLLALLVFSGGWQLGRVMSPYYAAHPIVFEEASCPGQTSVNGDPAALENLKQEGIAQRNNDPKPAAPQVAGGSSQADAPIAAKKFVGSINSDLFHDPACSSASRIKPENQVWFGSIEEAQAAGYSASKCTRDKLGIGE